MKGRLSESAIIRNVAEVASWRLARIVIKQLQRMKHTLSGDDSELKTTWDEICVQIQNDKSLHWDAYEFTARQLVEGYLPKLSDHEREAIWLQTQSGFEWSLEEAVERDPNPVVDDEIIDHVLHEYVYAEAGRWSNLRIREFIDRSAMRD